MWYDQMIGKRYNQGPREDEPIRCQVKPNIINNFSPKTVSKLMHKC